MGERLTRQMMVRISEEMYRALVEDAEANGRTVAQSVRFILSKSWLDILPPLRDGGDHG